MRREEGEKRRRQGGQQDGVRLLQAVVDGGLRNIDQQAELLPDSSSKQHTA